MQFIILHEKKLIIFWSPKCGCSTLKTILSFYLNIYDSNKYEYIHKNKELKEFINIKKYNSEVYKNYDIVMLIRNPYTRLVSGFINKYIDLKYVNPDNCDSFQDFCNILSKYPYKINKHHFEKQTTDEGWQFYLELGKPKIKHVLDTSQVNDLKKIINLDIDDIKLNETNKIVKDDNTNLWSKSYNSLKEIRNYNYSSFYNDDLKKLVYNIYKDDFIFFKENLGIDYDI